MIGAEEHVLYVTVYPGMLLEEFGVIHPLFESSVFWIVVAVYSTVLIYNIKTKQFMEWLPLVAGASTSRWKIHR